MTMTFYPADFMTNPDADVTENPAYRAELYIDFSNPNARLILASLGYVFEDSVWEPEAGDFAARVSGWLQGSLGKRSPAVATEVEAEPGRITFVHCGLPEGYLNRSIHRLSVFAREAVTAGATRIYAA